MTDDNARVGELVAATQGRITRALSAQATVNGLSAESSASTNVINELRERQQAQMLALSDAELAFVEQRIAGETANTETLVAGLGEAIDLGLKSRELQGSILAFQGSIMEQVSAEQEQLTELVSQIDDPAERRNLFIANQETLAELMKGIPEYLVSKRRSLETANLLLHLMRRRFAVVNAVTGADDSTPEVYVRNATQLGAMVDDIVNLRFFDERQINIDVAQIVVPANSGFARKLALTEAVDFEVSPFASTEALMKANGYFSIWAPNKFRDRRNMSLIDAFIGTQYQCTGAQWNRFALQHRGSGFVFRPLAEGSREVAADIAVGPERLALQTFFNLADSQDEVNRVIRYWVQDRFQVRAFPRPNGPPNDTASVLPYLGAPVDRLVPAVVAAVGLPLRQCGVHRLLHLRERAMRPLFALAALAGLGGPAVARDLFVDNLAGYTIRPAVLSAPNCEGAAFADPTLDSFEKALCVFHRPARSPADTDSVVSLMEQAQIRGLPPVHQQLAGLITGLAHCDGAKRHLDAYRASNRENELERTLFCRDRRLAQADLNAISWNHALFDYAEGLAPERSLDARLTEMSACHAGVLDAGLDAECGLISNLSETEITAFVDEAVGETIQRYFSGVESPITAMFSRKLGRAEGLLESSQAGIDALRRQRGRGERRIRCR